LLRSPKEEEMSTTSDQEFSKTEPLVTQTNLAPHQAAQPQAQAQAPQAKGPNIQVKGPPSGITVAGHGFWLLPPGPDGDIWAVFRPDGAYYFFPNDQQKK
jgi:hypothetical protein